MDEEHETQPALPASHDDENEAKKKRPYVTPKLECYGSVSGVTQNLLSGSFRGVDTLAYSY